MSGILGLGSSGSLELNSELIQKLKTAESTATLDPITEDIEETELEAEAISNIQTAMTEFLEIVENFDLYTSDTNVFNEITASTSGTSATFDATDTSELDEGTISVNIEQLAQKDVYQSTIISDITEEMEDGVITISIGEDSYDFSTSGKTYEELVEEMNYYTQLDVALEQVSDDTHRLVLKSSTSGTANALTITQTSIDLGLEDNSNHVLTAQNMLATVDGIDYDLSENKISMQNGLIITALEEGASSITLTQDSSYIYDAIDQMVTKYNEIVDLIDGYTLGDEDDTVIISDSSTLRTLMSGIKEIFFDNYGLDDEENIFAYGLSYDSDGYLQIDSSELSSAISTNYDNLKELFVGYAEKEGLGTRLSEYLDSLDGLDGLLSSYEDDLDDAIDTLYDDYDEASEKLDEKYELLAEQYAEYTVLITEMENSFASLQLMIDSESS